MKRAKKKTRQAELRRDSIHILIDNRGWPYLWTTSNNAADAWKKFRGNLIEADPVALDERVEAERASGTHARRFKLVPCGRKSK